MSASSSLPSELVLVEVYLRLGDDFYPIQLSQEDLNELAAGTLGELVIQDIFNDSQAQQPSLVYLMDQDGEEFWDSTPILVQEP